MSKMEWGPGMPAQEPKSEQTERHTIAVLVDNEPGVLARVIGLFSGRGYNIDSLTVTEVSHEASESRITIVTRGSPSTIEQIKSQLGRLVPVHASTRSALERYLAIRHKVRGVSDDLFVLGHGRAPTKTRAHVVFVQIVRQLGYRVSQRFT